MSESWEVSLQLVDGSSKKFWRARVEGGTLYVNYGRIGTNGQTQVKELGSADKARKELDKVPSTVVPIGFDPAGLPLSVQVIGRRGHDHLTVAVASALEEDFGGWQPARPSWRIPERFVGPDSPVRR